MKFKRISTNPDREGPREDDAFVLAPDVWRVLQEKRDQLSINLGVPQTFEQTILYALQNVMLPSVPPSAVAEKEKKRLDGERVAEDWMRAGQKINAIKVIRETTGMGLKDAKDYVEQKWNHLLPQR